MKEKVGTFVFVLPFIVGLALILHEGIGSWTLTIVAVLSILGCFSLGMWLTE